MEDQQQHVWPHGPRQYLGGGGDDEAHVWRVALRQDATVVSALRETLTPDERARADKFHFERDREHYVVARGALRDILGHYLAAPPASIRFSYSRHGKPALAGGAVPAHLRFNLSHSGELALVAVTRGREVGLDIELIRADLAGLDIAERFFSPREVRALLALPTELRTTAFFNCWTRKEAYIKALGEGLSHPLRSFAVSLAPSETAKLLSTDGDPQEAARWSLVDLSPGEGYAAALAVEGCAPLIRCWQWSAGTAPGSRRGAIRTP